MADLPVNNQILSRIQRYLGIASSGSSLAHLSVESFFKKNNPQAAGTLPLPPISFTLTRSAASVNEGESVTFFMNTVSVANGTTVPYTITGVSTSDIGGASLTGNFIINNGTASATFSITADASTEGVETMVMTSANQTVSVTINDTSTAPPTYTLSRAQDNVNEGGQIQFSMVTTNVSNGTLIPYVITGVTSDDINGESLTGNFVINNNQNHKIFTITADSNTEGVETMTLTSAGQTASVTINDTVITAITVSTFAGSMFNGYDDGQGTSARFDEPRGIAVAATGNIYVADTRNHRIRKITSSGVVTTLAGSGSVGAANGQGVAASFETPTGVAVDSSENVYVADWGNALIRKIDTAGNVTTLANIPGASAPQDVAIDTSGNVYAVSNVTPCIVFKITPSGTVTTLAGSTTSGNVDGQGTAAKFDEPTGIAVDTEGNVYVADSANNRIRKITPSGVVTTIAGVGATGQYAGDFVNGDATTTAKFKFPTDVVTDISRNVYVADMLNQRIRKISSSGNVTTLAGDGVAGTDDGLATSARFNSPNKIAMLSNGDLLVTNENSIRKISFTYAAAPTYTLTRSVASVNEGGTVTFTMTTTNVANGTTIPYTITGVSTPDIDGDSLTGNFTINNNTASLTLDITSDIITEGTETLTMTSAGQTVSVTINDTSTAPITTRPLFDRSTFSIVPLPYRTYLNAAVTRWENYIKIPDATWDLMKAAVLANGGGDWNGMRITEFVEQNYGAGHPDRGMIAACGPRNVFDLVQPGSSGLKFQPTGFYLEINKYWETAIPSGASSPFDADDWVVVMTHELGHGLGIGAFWQQDYQQYGAVPPIDFFLDDIYTNAQQGYNDITSNTYTKMPLEDAGGAGTASAHWEGDFRPGTAPGANGTAYPGIPGELMSGYFSKGARPKISKLSIGVLKDFGYAEVNPGTSEGTPTLDSSLIAALNAGDECHKLCCHRSMELADKACIGTIELPPLSA